jgi:hypothetical protein
MVEIQFASKDDLENIVNLDKKVIGTEERRSFLKCLKTAGLNSFQYQKTEKSWR